MYPRLKIYLKRIEENTRVVRQLCAGHGIRIMGVTKAAVRLNWRKLIWRAALP